MDSIRPGTDAALSAALAYVMITEDLIDKPFLAKYTPSAMMRNPCPRALQPVRP